MKSRDLLGITNRVYIIRNQKVMLDIDLAQLYGVEIKRLNEQVKRNIERFPEEFCFKLNSNELADIKSQNATYSDVSYRKGVTPTVFTEQGAYALSFVLRSPKAIKTGIFIAKAFTHLRRFILKNENLMVELKNNDHLSKTFSSFEKYVEQTFIVLYKNHSINQQTFKKINSRLETIETIINKNNHEHN